MEESTTDILSTSQMEFLQKNNNIGDFSSLNKTENDVDDTSPCEHSFDGGQLNNEYSGVLQQVPSLGSNVNNDQPVHISDGFVQIADQSIFQQNMVSPEDSVNVVCTTVPIITLPPTAKQLVPQLGGYSEKLEGEQVIQVNNPTDFKFKIPFSGSSKMVEVSPGTMVDRTANENSKEMQLVLQVPVQLGGSSIDGKSENIIYLLSVNVDGPEQENINRDNQVHQIAAEDKITLKLDEPQCASTPNLSEDACFDVNTTIYSWKSRCFATSECSWEE